MPHPKDPAPESPPVEVRLPVKAAVGVLVHASSDRAFAASTWLLAAAQDAGAARAAWEKPNGIALLRCGGIFSAVRLSTALVRAAADTENTREIDAFLNQALNDAPVFMDQYAQWYYVLVPVSTGRQAWLGARRPPGVEFLGRDCVLGVPRPDVSVPENATRSYWCVPPTGPGALAVPDAVAQLVSIGRFRLAAADAADGGTGHVPPSVFRA